MRFLVASFFLIPTILRTAVTVSSSMACNNSPSLCNRAYNNITHLGAHDSPFVRDASTSYSTSANQYYNSTVQLDAGVRLLTTQVLNTNSSNGNSGEWHVCHTSCVLLDAGRLSDWLREIKSWLDSHTSEVVTVLLVNDDDASASQLAGEYEAAGIAHYGYVPLSSSAATAWPTLDSLINDGTRLLSFVASLSDTSNAPYLMNEFSYIFENNYDNSDIANFTCEAARPSTAASNTQQAVYGGMMPLMNHFLYTIQAFGIETPDDQNITITNAPSGAIGNLGDTAAQCTGYYGKAPTFILVDFFNVGPAIETADRLNGVTDPVGRTNVSIAKMIPTSFGVKAGPGTWYAICFAAVLAFAYTIDVA